MNKTFLQFWTSNNAARHLGRKLYTRNPPAIAELIANSYDAYANFAHVIADSDNSKIIIADDGIGMTKKDLDEKYVEIGEQKQPVAPPKSMDYRLPMGKKGIGKLAAFSIGNRYTVYTKTTNDSKWLTFSLNYNDMIDNPKYGQKYRVPITYIPLIPFNTGFDNLDHGFVVEITHLRKQFTKQTADALKDALERRFSLRGEGFSITINGQKVDLSGEGVYRHVSALTYFGFSSDEIKSRFSCEHRRIVTSKEFEKLKNSYDNSVSKICIADQLSDNTDEHFEELKNKKVKAWVGVFDRPDRLKKYGMGSIIVYINGKVADEDFLRNEHDAMFSSQYVVGEIYADFLNNEKEEPITSSRQGLDDSDLNVELLQVLARKLKSRAKNQWRARRNKEVTRKLPSIIRNNLDYQKWIKSLHPLQKSLNTKLWAIGTIYGVLDFIL